MSSRSNFNRLSSFIALGILLTVMLGCKGGGGSSLLTLPPNLTMIGLKALQYNSTITFSVRVETASARTVNFAVLFKDGVGGAFEPATSEPGRPNPTTVQGLKVPAGGTTFTFWWHAIADLGIGENHNVYVKVLITEPDGRVTEVTSGPIKIDYTSLLGGVFPPFVPGGALPSTYCGQNYDARLPVQGGQPPFEWILLPPGTQLPYFLELTYDGHVRGAIPSGYGPVTIAFVARIIDSNPLVKRESAGLFTIFVDCEPVVPGCGPAPMINFTSMPAGDEDEAYIYQCTATGGDGDLTWTIIDGEFPFFLDLTPDGLITGTPPAGSARTYTFTIQVCDTCSLGAQCDTQVINYVVNPPAFQCDDPPVITTQSLPAAKEGIPYSQELLAAGGHGDTLTWTLIDGVLPTGVQLTPAGVLTGTPAAGTAQGTGHNYIVTIEVCDECPTEPQCNSKELGLTVNPPDVPCADPPSITTESPIPDATEDVPYNFQFTAIGGEGALRWILNSPGELISTGLVWNENGTISGTPNSTSANTLSLDITVEDSCTPVQTDSKMFLFTIIGGCAAAPEITTLEIPPGVEGLEYSYQFSAVGGEGILTWTRLSGPDWPTGLTLAESGLLSGTPAIGTAASSPYNGIEIQVSDACPLGVQYDTNLFNMEIFEACAPGPVLTTVVVPGAGIGQEYNFTFEATGGESALTWTLDTETGDELPDGLLFSDGTISGIPAAGTDDTYNLWVRVCDSCVVPQCEATGYELIVSEGCASAPEITTTSIPDGIVGEPYEFQFQATGGVGTLTWKVASILTLPVGFFMSTSGLFYGDPEIIHVAIYNFDVIVEDDCPLGAQQDIQHIVFVISNEGCMPAPDIITPPSLTIPAGSGIDLRFSALNGEGALTWTLLDADPALPGTVTFSAEGNLIGTTEIADAGTYLLDIQVCDECTDPGVQCDTMLDFELVLEAASGCGSGPPAIQDLTIPTPTSDGAPYSYTMTATGGDGPLNWSAAGLPPTMFIDPVSGEIQGAAQPSHVGTWRVIIWVIDACSPVPQADSEEYIWNIV